MNHEINKRLVVYNMSINKKALSSFFSFTMRLILFSYICFITIFDIYYYYLILSHDIVYGHVVGWSAILIFLYIVPINMVAVALLHLFKIERRILYNLCYALLYVLLPIIISTLWNYFYSYNTVNEYLILFILQNIIIICWYFIKRRGKNADIHTHKTSKLVYAIYIIVTFVVILLPDVFKKEHTAATLIKDAKCIDSISIVPPDEEADINRLQLRGLSMEQVKKLYGDFDAQVYNVCIDSPQCLPNENLDDIFVKSDYSMVVTICYWGREDKGKKLLKSNDCLWNYQNPQDSLGMCLKVSFVKYKGENIVYDAIQTETTVDDILAIDRTQIE